MLGLFYFLTNLIRVKYMLLYGKEVNRMSNCEDFEIFPNEPKFISGKETIINLTNTLNDDLNEWVLVKVPIKHEFVDELTEIIKYEWRYRLYLSKFYEMLGFDSFFTDKYSGYYWEKDKDGNITDYHLP